jgi:hypothetical protein
MNVSNSADQEAANSRLNWSVVYVCVPVIAIIGAVLVLHRPSFVASTRALLFAVVAIGIGVIILVNWARPRYENSAGRTRRIYDFLLRQFPPPD